VPGPIYRIVRAGGTIAAPVPWPADRVAAMLQADDGRIIGLAVADRDPSS